ECERDDMLFIRLREDRAVAFRIDFVESAFVARAYIEIALLIECERPDVFVFGIEEDARFAVGRYAIDFAVGRPSREKIARRVKGKCGDVEFFRIEQHSAFARLIDFIDSPVMPRAEIDVPGRIYGA